MKSKERKVVPPTADQQSQGPVPAELRDLQRAQELRRVLGDPRVRVQVPTENDAGIPPTAPMAQRYQIG